MPHEFLLACRDNEPVGRIAVFINPAHLARHNDQTGHFGFLDTLQEDDETISALMQAAESWLRWKGMLRIAGPFNFSVNEECGLLVDGFDTPPVMMMLHGRPDYAPALEQAGYSKAMDMHFWWSKNREQQGQFFFHWRNGKENRGDYFTKHHSPAHHRIMRRFYMHEPDKQMRQQQ